MFSVTSQRSGFQKCSFHHQRPGKYRKQKEAKDGLFSFLTGWRHMQWSEVNFGFNVTFKYKYITFKTIK